MSASRILIVRLGSLGDIIHTLPAAAAIRRAFPEAVIDWLVDVRQQEVLELVPVIDRRIPVNITGPRAIYSIAARAAPRPLRHRPRFSGTVEVRRACAAVGSAARSRVSIGIAARAGSASVLHGKRGRCRASRHRQEPLDVEGDRRQDAGGRIPARRSQSGDRGRSARAARYRQPGSLCRHQPGCCVAKQTLAACLLRRGRPRAGEAARSPLARHVGPRRTAAARTTSSSASDGTAAVAPSTTIADLVSLLKAASLMVSGERVRSMSRAPSGTPLVGIFGPTDPAAQRPLGRRRSDGVALSARVSVTISGGATSQAGACWISRRAK